MIINDRVYGKFEITEPVILDLLRSPSLGRLEHIDQAGYSRVWFPGSDRSRLEHSLGVYYLLFKYGAPPEEQIAGLIHDVSHAAFSHSVDYVLTAGSEKEQNHQDNVFFDFVRKSEIPAILKKYKIDWHYVLDENNFPLEEKPLPDLCADRLDYSFRDGVGLGVIKKEGVKYFLKNLTAENNLWIFKDFSSALRYAEYFLNLNINWYSGILTGAMFRATGDCLKYSLKKNYFTRDDLYTTDDQVLDKIHAHLSEDAELSLLWDRMNGKVKYKNDPRYLAGRVFCKSRIVDPLCWHGGEIRRVSEIKPKWAKIIKNELQPKEYFIKFER